MNNDELDAALKHEQAKRRRRALAMTPEERIERHLQIQAEAMATLRANPAAWEAFQRRNHHQRRASLAAAKVAEMKRRK